MESSEFFSKLNKSDFDMTVCGWVGLVDPDEYFATIYHSDGEFNQQQYHNPEVDRLIEAGRATDDRDRRREIYKQVQQKIALDAPTVFLYVTDQISAYRDDVKGFDVHPTATTISLRNVTLE